MVQNDVSVSLPVCLQACLLCLCLSVNSVCFVCVFVSTLFCSCLSVKFLSYSFDCMRLLFISYSHFPFSSQSQCNLASPAAGQ